jgi:hypothetical protein
MDTKKRYEFGKSGDHASKRASKSGPQIEINRWIRERVIFTRRNGNEEDGNSKEKIDSVHFIYSSRW